MPSAREATGPVAVTAAAAAAAAASSSSSSSTPAAAASSTPSTTSQSSSAPRRIACDRCHGQKLKCPRDVTGAEPCTRCAKAGAVCQVSPARATGRPAKHPKPQNTHRRSESSISTKSSKSSAVESGNSTEADIKTPETPPVSANHPGPFVASSETCFLSPTMQYMPMADETMNFYPASDMQFDFVDMPDPAFPGSLNFDYNNDGTFIDFGSPLQTMMPPSLPPKSSAMAGYACTSSQFGEMLPPPTPAMTIPEEVHEIMTTPEDSTFSRRSSSTSNSLSYDYNTQDLFNESYPVHFNGTGAHSPGSKRGFTVAEEPHIMASLPIRSVSGDDLNSKRRRLSTIVSCTPEQEHSRSSDLGYSQALSSIQLQVDNFSNSLGQALGPVQNGCFNSNINIDVGVLLPIADRFMALVSQIHQQSMGSKGSTQPPHHATLKNVAKPTLDRTQSEPDPATMDNMVVEPKSISASLIQLIFTCHTRLLFAFSIALDVIHHNLSVSNVDASATNHPMSTIGSYTLPNSSPLSTLLHLHAISHSLDRLDATLHKAFSVESTPTTNFFDGIFCKQKRNEMAINVYKERAFEEASQQKNNLMMRVRAIVAGVAEGDEI